MVPLIFFTGQGLFPYSTDVFDLFGQQCDLARQLLTGPYPLVQLSELSDETIYTHKWTGLLELLMKHARQRDALGLIKKITQIFIEPLLAEPHTDSYILSMLKYSLDQGEVKNLDLFFELIQKELPKEVEKNMTTIAEQLRQQGMQQGMQQGIQQGMQQGIQQGIQQGMQQGEAALFIQLLQYRFKTLPLQYQERIAQTDAKTLLEWGKKILEAKTLEEVFEN